VTDLLQELGRLGVVPAVKIERAQDAVALGRSGFMHSAAVGKAMLAFLCDSEVEGIIDAHGLPALVLDTIIDKGQPRKELERVRKLGYAIDAIENEESIRRAGAPILDHTGNPVAAMSISGPAFRLTRQRIQELVEPLTSAAEEISRRLGHSRGQSFLATCWGSPPSAES